MLYVTIFSGDSLDYHNGQFFSTYDQKNDKIINGNCSGYYKNVGWWFKDCHEALPTGEYKPSSDPDKGRKDGIYWTYWKKDSAYKSFRMKMRPIQNT